ncbi:hypothetical protein C6376_39220 [Streptomyces sp. P3]|uniref:hypothetical protein n=1 Tax=unclassified Streptomyces TaxID=2593676 RepID=UPI000D1B513A|nr:MULTISPECIES: hypothetical protein [unclassified Streptomyces]AVV46447.1 hypothetical protein C6376_38920 [Streptomyces sp. P3]AVV46506.1 hypothetical protein C6376_39220 [Streptomyces sp. P3]
MSDYRDVQTAVRVEKLRIWFAWLAGTIIILIIARAVRNLDVVNIIVQILGVIAFALLSVTAVRMINALNRKAAAKRREVLGDDV